MVIKAKQAFVTNTEGKLTSYGYGMLYSVSDELGGQLISDGLAEEYTGEVVQPVGTLTITENGTYSVLDYASVEVAVEAAET